MSVEMGRIGGQVYKYFVDYFEFSNNLLFRNAEPELDFKYFSKARAKSLDLKALYHSIVNGALLAE